MNIAFAAPLQAAPSQAAPSRSTLQGPPTSTEKSQSPEVEDSSSDPKVDVVADPHRAMASDGLMTFCLERKADAKTVPEGLVAEAVDGRENAVESVETVKEAEPVEDAKAPATWLCFGMDTTRLCGSQFFVFLLIFNREQCGNQGCSRSRRSTIDCDS